MRHRTKCINQSFAHRCFPANTSAYLKFRKYSTLQRNKGFTMFSANIKQWSNDEHVVQEDSRDEIDHPCPIFGFAA